QIVSSFSPMTSLPLTSINGPEEIRSDSSPSWNLFLTRSGRLGPITILPAASIYPTLPSRSNRNSGSALSDGSQMSDTVSHPNARCPTRKRATKARMPRIMTKKRGHFSPRLRVFCVRNRTDYCLLSPDYFLSHVDHER